MKSVLVTGVSGFVGNSLSREFAERGYAVRGAIRLLDGGKKYPDWMQCAVVGNIDSNTNWDEALEDVEVVVHLAARVHVLKEKEPDPLAAFRMVNVEGTKRLALAAAAKGVKRLIFISSIGVNGQITDKYPFTEKNTPQPYDPYSISKWEAEQALHRIGDERGIETVILRPPLVYGTDAPGNFSRLTKLVKSGLPLPLGSVKNNRSFIYVNNLVDAIILCAEHPAAVRQTFLVSDGQDISTPAFIRLISHAMGKEPHVVPFPPRLLKTIGKLLGKESEVDRLIGSLVLDIEKIRRELGWTPPYTMEQGLLKSVERYTQS